MLYPALFGLQRVIAQAGIMRLFYLTLFLYMKVDILAELIENLDHYIFHVY